jgi:Metallo-peptidase family M12
MFYSSRYIKIFASLFLILALNAFRCEAGVAILANDTNAPVHFSVVNADGKQQKFTLERGDVIPIPIVDKMGVAFESEGKPRGYALPANAIFHFVMADKALDLRMFPIPAPPDEDPNLPPPKARDIAHATLTIPVKILADDDQPVLQKIWEKELRERIEAASEIFERHCGVRFEVKAVETWVTDNAITDFQKTLLEFESKVNPAPAALAIGFTSQYSIPHGVTHLGGTHGPLCPYILIREWSQHVSKSERLEILVHEMGHYLGASHSADPDSVMRPQLGDRRSHSLSFRIGFDPLNTLAINLVADELRSRTYHGFPFMPLDTRRELQRIYLALGKELPDDPAQEEFIALLNLPRPASAMPPRKPSELVLATQAVVQTIANAARVNGRASTELKADVMTEYYISRAATAAISQPPALAAKAFLLGIGVGLDDDKLWRDFPMLGGLCREVESDFDRQNRLSVLGRATIFGRHDLAEHFILSCALTVQLGPAAAEQLGIAKEIKDAQGESGFSFVDLSADMAGVAFATSVLAGKIPLDKIADSFTMREYIPDIKNLKEGISWKDFTENYGSLSDNRYQKVRAEIQKRILELPCYKKK